MEFIMAHSKMLGREENQWMLMVIQIVRKTDFFSTADPNEDHE
jgi:hypothetical protein